MSAEHHHAPAEFNRAFAIGIALNTGFVPFEAFYGWKMNSLALLADAEHNLNALTAHRVMPEGQPGDAFLLAATRGLHDQFEIEHVTLQVVQVAFCRPGDCASTATTASSNP